jgi:hypothetical protein
MLAYIDRVIGAANAPEAIFQNGEKRAFRK